MTLSDGDRPATAVPPRSEPRGGIRPRCAGKLTEEELAALRPLQRQFPTLDAALGEIARLSGELTHLMGTIHVISDIHGEDVKLRHVINNASGMLRPLIKRMFGPRLNQTELQEFLTLLFYPREMLEQIAPRLRDLPAREDFCRRILGDLFELVGLLARRYPAQRALGVVPEAYREIFLEALRASTREHGQRYYDALIEPFIRHDRALHLIRQTVRVVRNLAIDELIIAGDCWDRGARGDRVVDYLQYQPNVSFIWGNHDAAWLGASLGQQALVAHVLRISLRYQRLGQLEEGYAISLDPLEHLARQVYADDPATCFRPKGDGTRDPQVLARMQKAAAIMQFKLEGDTIARNPHWGLSARRLLHTIDRANRTIEIDGKRYPLRDTYFPTIDPGNPYALSAEERTCMNHLCTSFLSSQKLWDHMQFLLSHGSMYLRRDDNLIFHGCVPVDESGAFLPLTIDGLPVSGKEMFDAIDRVLARILNQGQIGTPDGAPETQIEDRDLMWYLWCGPRSPLFGKDRIATLELDLVADPSTQVETKNPYFHLIHEVEFCERILTEFETDPRRGLIVNGHVPVKIEKGESPLKRSGKAITIDGAFSSAYGDHGYTLVLEPEKTLLATHHHFESADAAVREGVDIIPTVSTLREWAPPRRVADTEQGDRILHSIAWLERLVQAYRDQQLRTDQVE
jgi:fructose-1,6-bisphosphatase III